jgi:hypothetical protein
LSRHRSFPASITRLTLSGAVSCIGYWYFVSVASCYASGLHLCFAFGLVTPILMPLAILFGSAPISFGSTFGPPLLITLFLLGLYEFCAWRQQQSSLTAPVLYEVFDRVYMGIAFLVCYAIIFWVCALVAALLFYGSTPLTGSLVLSFLAFFGSFALAAYTLVRSIAVLVRLLLHLPLLIVTTDGLGLWDFLGYRRISWDDFDRAEYVSVFNPQGGWPRTYIRIRYRSSRPSLFQRAQRFFPGARKDYVSTVVPLDTVVPDTPDIAEAINRTKYHGGAS